MREALFRAAQQGAYFTDEETVGRWQDDELTTRVLDGSLAPIPAASAPRPQDEPLIVWPYPRGTMHIIDRANCADHFLRANPGFQLVTEAGLTDPADLPRGPVLLFTPFDTVVTAIRHDDSGYLTMGGRRISAMLNELALAHLVRHGVLSQAPAVSAAGYRPIVTPPGTHLVNGTQLTLFKARQMRHVADLADQLRPLGVVPMPYASSVDRADAIEAVVALCTAGESVVVRPFGASQGTGVSMIGPVSGTGARRAAGLALDRLDSAVTDKYGAPGAYPVTVTPFVESRKIGGAVSDVRMFVVYDRASGGLRAIPGMVRRAERPFRAGEPLTRDIAMTNVSGAGPGGPRVFPLTRPDVLAQLGISPAALVRLGLAASTIWATAVEAEAAERDTPVPFSYGSVDFLIRQDDGRAVPIELNGANVGEHPTVAVHRLDLFAEATTAALTGLGLAGPAWAR
jgi:hypothetical protein